MAENDKSLGSTIEETKRIWQELGQWWAEGTHEGDAFHKEFIFPYIQKLASVKSGNILLDAGCGSGALARLFAKENAQIVAVDFSASLLKEAQEYSKGLNIDYREIDLTNTAQLKALSNEFKFDTIICSMVLHNMPTIEPLFESLHYLLKPCGNFIFSIPHPCFNTEMVKYNFSQTNLPAGTFITTSNYSKAQVFRVKSKPNQPVEQLSFDRPLTDILNMLLKNGLVMSGFEEPIANSTSTSEHKGFWHNYPHVPPALIARWTLLA